MKRITNPLPWEIAWCITLIIVLAFGIYAGYSVTQAIADTELMYIQAQLETANASLAELSVELSFWRDTVQGLVNGDQLDGKNIKRPRPNVED